MKCPVCRALYRASPNKSQTADAQDCTSHSSGVRALNCRRCGADLAPLIGLHDQAIWHHRQAIQAFSVGDYATAIAQNNQALALHSHQADFHALAGQLWALQGNVALAIASWKTAQHLNPQHPTATILLQHLGV